MPTPACTCVYLIFEFFTSSANYLSHQKILCIKGRKIGEPHLQESEESQIKEENLDFISSQ